MKRCKTCLIPTSRPDTEFVGGICSACIAYKQQKRIDWDARKEQLVQLLDKHDGRCLVPSSGGKDSTWQVIALLEMGADVTIVTATTCHLTPIGRRNIDNLSQYADTIEITPNREVRARLNRYCLKMLGDVSWPEHVLIHTAPFRVALEMGVPLVFYGENPLNAYGGPTELQAEQRMTRRWTAEFGGFLGMRPSDFVGVEGLTERDMRAYTGPDDAALDKAEVEAYFLGQFLPWDSRRNLKVAVEHGFETAKPCNANWWAGENLDNAQTGLHDVGMYLKYGYGRACAQLSVDIRSRELTRSVAGGILRGLEPYAGEIPVVYAGVHRDDMLEQIGLTVSEAENILSDYARK